MIRNRSCTLPALPPNLEVESAAEHHAEILVRRSWSFPFSTEDDDWNTKIFWDDIDSIYIAVCVCKVEKLRSQWRWIFMKFYQFFFQINKWEKNPKRQRKRYRALFLDTKIITNGDRVVSWTTWSFDFPQLLKHKAWLKKRKRLIVETRDHRW